MTLAKGAVEPAMETPPLQQDGFSVLQARPSLNSHYSNSVPSTPHQLPRDHSKRSRTPSPHGPLGSHSPRSVVSEANGVISRAAPLSRPLLPCKHEKPLPGRKRRIPYGTGEDPLEKVKPEPKKTLDPEEEAKLGREMDDLYKRLIPSEESEARRTQLVQKLETILREEWPGYQFKVHMFGSSGNKLCTSESDVDLCIQTDYTPLETVHDLAEALHKRRMQDVICVAGAKIPIVKFEDPELQLKCDLNVNTVTSLENTRMIKTYVEIDDRVRPLAMIVKYWTKQRGLNEALNGVLNTYTWTCLIINFLQTRNPPILPALHELPHKTRPDSPFADNLHLLQGFGKENKETLPQLLFAFYRWYAHEVDYEQRVISVRTGRLMSREEKGWDLRSLVPEARQRLCVEEPFFIHRNIGYTADNESFRGIHLELRQAFSALADGAQLDKCCEAFVEEMPTSLSDSGIFQKPAAAPKPTLTSATAASPRSARAGPNNRGNRGSNGQRSNQSSRRNSSGNSFSGRGYNQLPSPGLIPGTAVGAHIHDLLLQRYIALEHERAQMEHILRASQVHPVALSQNGMLSPTSQPPLSSPPHQTQFAIGQHGPHMPDGALSPTSGYIFRYPMHYEQGLRPSAALSMSGEGFRTNPNSPTLSTRAPAIGREPQRMSVSGGIPNGSIRSQSQPARTASLQLPQGYSSTLLQDPLRNPMRPHVNMSPELPHNFLNLELPLRQGRGYSMSVGDYGPPREYLGYSIGESPRIEPQQDMLPPPRTFYDENARSARGSPELIPPPRSHYFGGHPSRSPSPLRHARSFSAAGAHFGPAPLSAGLTVPHRMDPVQNPSDNGLMISTGHGMPTLSPLVSPTDRSHNVPSQMPLVDEPESMSVSEASDQGSGKSWEAIPPPQPVIANGSRPMIANGSGPSAHSGLGDDSWVTVERQPSAVPTGPPQSRSRSRDESRRSPNNMSKPFASVNGHIAQPTLHLRSPIHESLLDKIPLLSPVEESRTPSPTTSRRSLHSKQASLNSIDMKHSDPPLRSQKDSTTNSRPAPTKSSAAAAKLAPLDTSAKPAVSVSGVAEKSNKRDATPASATASSAHAQVNGWQQQTSKRNGRKRVKSGSAAQKGGSEAAAAGKNGSGSVKEVMPLVEAERKGG